MRVVITHDTDGNIASAVASPADAPLAHGMTGPGQLTTEIDVPDLDANLGMEQLNGRLTDLIENYQIDAQPAAGKLTKKPSATSATP